MGEAGESWRYPAPMPQGAVDAGQVLMRDGTTAELRRVRHADGPLLAEFLGRVSAEARRQRFLGELPAERATELLLRHGPPEDRTALLVLTGSDRGPRVVAHGEYARDGAESAEVSFLVADDFHGRGLGTLLLERLALIAVRHGIMTFRATTGTSNVQMREVFRQSGFPVSEERVPGEIAVSFAITPTEESVRRAETRERIATVASLRPFLRPRGVMVVGADTEAGRRVLANLTAAEFPGPVRAVSRSTVESPDVEEFRGVSPHPAVTDVPAPVDLAVLALPAPEAYGVVAECGRLGVRAVIVAGDAPEGAGRGERDWRELLAVAVRERGMRLLGPESLGVVDTAEGARLNASLVPALPDTGPVAVASQSGTLGVALLERARELGLGVSSFVSLGAKADVSGNDLLQYWEDDPATRVILFYLESFGNPRRFARLARRVSRRKPIVVVKGGRGVGGARAGAAGTEALFRQAGVVRADTLEGLFDAAAVLAWQPLPAGPRVAVLTNARGPGILAVDALETAGLTPARPADAFALAARADGGYGAGGSGALLDLGANAGPAEYREAVSAALGSAGCDAVLVVAAAQGGASPTGLGEAVVDAVVGSPAAGTPKPVLLCTLGRDLPLARPGGGRIPTYRFPEAAARALGLAYEYAEWRRRPPGRVPELAGLDLPAARAVWRQVAARGGGEATVGEAERLLTAFGLPIGPQASRQAGEVAEVGMGIEVGAGMEGGTGAERGAGAEADAGAEGGAGVAVRIGVADDPLFGPLVTLGLGGPYAEALGPAAVRLTPLTDRDAHELVHSVPGHSLLTGRDGPSPSDVGALVEVLLRLSRLVEELPQVAELSLDPVLVLAPGRGCRIAGVRVRFRPRAGGQGSTGAPPG